MTTPPTTPARTCDELAVCQGAPDCQGCTQHTPSNDQQPKAADMSTPDNTPPHIGAMRAHLMATLADLRNREHPMEPDRARAVASVASVLVDSAKVEVDYLRATKQEHSEFLLPPPKASLVTIPNTPQDAQARLPNGITSITQHALQG
jgi:hypothetical protein